MLVGLLPLQIASSKKSLKTTNIPQSQLSGKKQSMQCEKES